ncbi:MAG: hypothetical protein ACK59A_10885 [Cyanobacteriota bacterium]|jgi:hypothetical protein
MNDHANFKRNLLCFFAALPLPFIIYVVVFLFRGTPVRLDWFFAMVSAFSSGLMSLPAPLSGFHFVILPLALTIVSTTILSYHRSGGAQKKSMVLPRFRLVSASSQ